MEDTFIEERLAAAMKLSPSQRSPEVAAFIGACQLQQEVAREGQSRRLTRKQQALCDLKLIRSHVLSIAPFFYRPGVQLATWGRLCSAANVTEVQVAGDTGERFMVVGDVGKRIMELLDSDFSIGTLLLVAAGASTLGAGVAPIRRLLPVFNRVIEKMQRPAVAARLRQELEQLQADLPSSLLSYEQLLTRFVLLGCKDCEDLAVSGDKSMPDEVDLAFRATAQLLPRLAADQLWLQFCSIVTAHRDRGCSVGIVSKVKQVRELLERAQQQGSNFVAGHCGYELAACAQVYGWYAARLAKAPGQAWGSLAGLDAAETVAPPSAFLTWLKQARQAHTRCLGVLPGQWLAGLKAGQQRALAWKPWLKAQQQLGDRWQPPDLAEVGLVRAQGARQAKSAAQPSIYGRCTGCGTPAAHLQLCGGCKQVQYCSRSCQKADWSRHKAECKANQQPTKGQTV
ncbi:hypothetical protein N2152v2_007569 [Parachlorella kessleri]